MMKAKISKTLVRLGAAKRKTKADMLDGMFELNATTRYEQAGWQSI